MLTSTFISNDYHSFATLAKHKVENEDYSLISVIRNSGVAILAPHGGDIERGTTQLAQHIAGEVHTFYSFLGHGPDAGKLHITSTRFDEPQALAITSTHPLILTLHVCRGEEKAVYIGGRNQVLKHACTESLEEFNFTATMHPRPALHGVKRENICNRGNSEGGVQIELAVGLIRDFFTDQTLAVLTNEGMRFVKSIKAVLSSYKNKDF